MPFCGKQTACINIGTFLRKNPKIRNKVLFFDVMVFWRICQMALQFFNFNFNFSQDNENLLTNNALSFPAEHPFLQLALEKIPNDYQSFEWLLFKLKVSKYNLKWQIRDGLLSKFFWNNAFLLTWGKVESWVLNFWTPYFSVHFFEFLAFINDDLEAFSHP